MRVESGGFLIVRNDVRDRSHVDDGGLWQLRHDIFHGYVLYCPIFFLSWQFDWILGLEGSVVLLIRYGFVILLIWYDMSGEDIHLSGLWCGDGGTKGAEIPGAGGSRG